MAFSMAWMLWCFEHQFGSQKLITCGLLLTISALFNLHSIRHPLDTEATSSYPPPHTATHPAFQYQPTNQPTNQPVTCVCISFPLLCAAFLIYYPHLTLLPHLHLSFSVDVLYV